MTHTVHPYAHRLGIIKGWRSRWFSTNAEYRKNLKCDILLREWLAKRMRGMYIADVEIERNDKHFRVIIKTSRPGLIIGRSGEGVTKLKTDIIDFMKNIKADTKTDIKIEIEEVKNPEASAAIVAQMIAEGLEKRMPFRRVMKSMIEKVMACRDVQGVRIFLSGRLGGAEMARCEDLKRGRIPLQTFRANIDFKRYEAHLPYGNIGIKVWI
ncbi:MAG: 30S ribosomal protein S3, partial [Candidatus Pacebacteria bacterium]|nr:30S ribosomal protein S3 [Candidatus Paceibacterota bacterium]